ncbi:hypothetical protein [Winogradskyella bathintestinalis]|uniref:CarboxypepD_reg-like domain-containing protein n=1 Tax=Winogradskyella bathintestinalis TaxID=3035208 RepID=A0ABT7ZW17_9FLAO|nr:hypothetical protein [Winogradskyella bathintestinalis]MDN3493212.1 hypothetical protein [Winogradskyella bathintestinalis]
MRHITILFVLLCWPLAQYAQTLNGKIYDAKGVAKNIKIYNETQKKLTITNSEGDFSLSAKVNDTLLFESIFYHPKAIVLNDSHFEGVAVFEVKEILTELDEVEIKSEIKQPIFTEETYNAELKNILKEDIKNNPHLYKPAGGNILALLSLVGKLLKKKNKKDSPIYHPISYTQMDSLFQNSAFFNKHLMSKNLEIPNDKIYLFYDFCEAKGISSELLKDKNKMQLLEELVLNSQLFLILLEQYGEENVIKD